MITIRYLRLVYSNGHLIAKSREYIVAPSKLAALAVLADWNRVASLQANMGTPGASLVYLYLLTELKPEPYYYAPGDIALKTCHPNAYSLKRDPDQYLAHTLTVLRSRPSLTL